MKVPKQSLFQKRIEREKEEKKENALLTGSIAKHTSDFGSLEVEVFALQAEVNLQQEKQRSECGIQEKQKSVETEILSHLRQISIWESPHEMVNFLNDCVTVNYLHSSSDLLCFLYEELQQPLPSQLKATIFSPSKSDTSR